MSNMANNEPYSGRIIISPKIIQEISKYPNALDSIREYVANAWDADADRLEITIADNFLRIEDWGTGIANFELFWGIADQHKLDIELTSKFKRKPIGRKGMGKLSYMMLAEKILVESRTAYKAEYSDADLPKMKFDVIPRKKLDEVLTHKGTQITIRDLKREIKKDELIKYLKENLYGLILPIACKDHPMKIFVNGEKVTPTSFDGESGIISTSLGAIYCKLKPSKTSKIDALFRGGKVPESLRTSSKSLDKSRTLFCKSLGEFSLFEGIFRMRYFLISSKNTLASSESVKLLLSKVGMTQSTLK